MMRKYSFIFAIFFAIAVSVIWLTLIEKNNQQNISTLEYHLQTKETIYQSNKPLVRHKKPDVKDSRDAEFSLKLDLRQIEILNFPKLNKKIRTYEGVFEAITDLRKTLDEINGNFDSLDTKMIFSLAQMLDICFSKPQTQHEQDEYEHNYYFASGGEKSKMDFFYKSCSGVTDEELAMAYPLMEQAANEGLADAVLSYSVILNIPDYTVGQAYSFEEETPGNQKSLSRHNEKSTRMLEELVENGSISAVFNRKRPGIDT